MAETDLRAKARELAAALWAIDHDRSDSPTTTSLIEAALAAVQQESYEKAAQIAEACFDKKPYRTAGEVIADAIRALSAPKAPRPEATRSASSQQLIRRLREMATEVITQPWLERKALLMQNALNDAADEIERLKRVNATHTTE